MRVRGGGSGWRLYDILFLAVLQRFMVFVNTEVLQAPISQINAQRDARDLGHAYD